MTDMPDILQRICRVKRDEIRQLAQRGEGPLLQEARAQERPRGFRRALAESEGVALVAEIKKASPSKGIIREDFDPVDIARQYAAGGANCISVLTDMQFFHGRLEFLRQVRQAVSLPLLRKDFLLEEIQVVESRAWGADCVLLIVAALEAGVLKALLGRSRALGMDALVEVHDQKELEAAMDAGADLVGVNNRDLRTFEVDLQTTERLAAMIPKGVIVVAESGISTRNEIGRLKMLNVDAVLVGECLMRADDIPARTRDLSSV